MEPRVTTSIKNPSGSRTSSCLPDDIAVLSLHHGILADVGDEEEHFLLHLLSSILGEDPSRYRHVSPCTDFAETVWVTSGSGTVGFRQVWRGHVCGPGVGPLGVIARAHDARVGLFGAVVLPIKAENVGGREVVAGAVDGDGGGAGRLGAGRCGGAEADKGPALVHNVLILKEFRSGRGLKCH